MFLLSLRRAWRQASAVAIVSAFVSLPLGAQQTQPTTSDSSKSKREMKMPMKMQMGAASQKKNTAASSKAESSGAGKKTGLSTKDRSKSRVGTKKGSPTMAMPMRATSAPKRNQSDMRGMQMGVHPPAAHGDTVNSKMGAMDMQKIPAAAKDSSHMNMPSMPSKPDSAHMNMPGMAGMSGMHGQKHDTSAADMRGMRPGMNTPGMHGHTTEDMMIGPAGVSMERMGSGTTWIPARFNVGAAQLGYIREVARTHWATIGLGAAGTFNFVPSTLEPYYGSKTPVGAFVFLAASPFSYNQKGNDRYGGMDMGLSHE
jgi:hypothetical protein